MTSYILPLPNNNLTGILTFLQYVNTLVDGFLGIAFLIMVGMVAFLSTKVYTYERALAFSAFLTMICAILLRFVGIVNDYTMAFCIIAFIGATLLLMRERGAEK